VTPEGESNIGSYASASVGIKKSSKKDQKEDSSTLVKTK
jgi:hypothetical protein